MPLKTPRDLFVHELGDMMSAEHIILGMLPELAKEVNHSEAKKAFQDHEKETRDQIKNLEKVFKQLGEEPEETTCHATEGLKKEHESLKEEDPSPEVLEIGNVVGAAKTEHYEIASYTALVQMAKDLGETDAAKLLQENLDQEQAMSKRVESIAKELGKEAKAQMKEQEKESAA